VSHFYLDASAVVKRYSPETGSARVKDLTDPTAGHTIVLGEITLAEVAPRWPPNTELQAALPSRNAIMP
jgi:predicted nucleic acid-binding protein